MIHKESITTTEYAFTAVFEPAGGGYVVTFPAITNLATHGETLEEARERAAACLRLYLEGRLKDRLPLPASDLHRIEAVRSLVKVTLQTV
jgi:predicted RNase H-like HicB family nuclease